MTPAIQLNNVSKTYSKGKTKVEAVKNISLTVESGQVFGFLGPNGAGKSSTIRMMMNLVRPTVGDVIVLGKNVQREPSILHRVGALVEGAKFYEFLTGRKNLQQLATLSNCRNDAKIEQLLQQMTLGDRADRPVRGYSTGMKQRLGIAAALLHEPDLIILDEPTNGLDPAGIQEIRYFIKRLATEMGKTIFLSSHLLGEVEQVCDQVAIINHGEILRTGSVQSLLAEQEQVRIEVDDVVAGTAVLTPAYALTTDDNWLTITATRDQTPAIIQQLVTKNIAIYQVVVQQQKLEDVFLSLTKEGIGDQGSGIGSVSPIPDPRSSIPKS